MSDPAKSWIAAWLQSFGFQSEMPGWVFTFLALICIYFVIVIPCCGAMAYVDRKIAGDFQARVGPNRAGPAGILQPIADLLKLLQKEPQRKWNWREALWVGVHTMALYSTLAVLPLGSLALMVDTDMSAFIPFWSALVLALGTMLLGLTQGSVAGWFGGIRVAAQTLAGAFPALVSLLCVGLRSGSFRWSSAAAVQVGSPLSWTALSNPFQFIAFVVFVISGLVLLEVPPLDGGVSLSDIHGGVSAHLHGRRLSLYRLGRFYGFFLWAVITVTLFLGAWNLPFHLEESSVRLTAALELSWLLMKTFTLMLAIMWVARVNPRSRVDQITDFAWRVLSPFSLAALVGSCLWAGWRAFT
ncbi:MAG: complex I subunit 1/NuoH family protein [Bdellovibrionota bacterium]